MFCESYFIFSIGNITPIFQTTYKDCYKQVLDVHGEPHQRRELHPGLLLVPPSQTPCK